MLASCTTTSDCQNEVFYIKLTHYGSIDLTKKVFYISENGNAYVNTEFKDEVTSNGDFEGFSKNLNRYKEKQEVFDYYTENLSKLKVTNINKRKVDAIKKVLKETEFFKLKTQQHNEKLYKELIAYEKKTGWITRTQHASTFRIEAKTKDKVNILEVGGLYSSVFERIMKSMKESSALFSKELEQYYQEHQGYKKE